jgi:MOSC domain-containing protein
VSARVTAIYRYPVKGLSAEPMENVALSAGKPLPFDRAWAIENGPSRFDPDDPKPVPDISFLILMRDERLAALEARFEEETQRLILSRGGQQVTSGQLTSPAGRQIIEQFFAAFMSERLRGRPKVVSAPGHSFMEGGRIHLINLATLRELERAMGRPVDPIRFRANIVIDGAEPWAELDWVGKEIAAGPIRFEVTERTSRCAATNVNPATATRDMDIPAAIRRQWRHTDFGVYVEVVQGGELAVGDAVDAPPPANA